MFQGFREDEGACNMRREENVQHVNEVGYSVDIFGSPNGNIVDSIPAYIYIIRQLKRRLHEAQPAAKILG